MPLKEQRTVQNIASITKNRYGFLWPFVMVYMKFASFPLASFQKPRPHCETSIWSAFSVHPFVGTGGFEMPEEDVSGEGWARVSLGERDLSLPLVAGVLFAIEDARTYI